jgi:hypothetical protein
VKNAMPRKERGEVSTGGDGKRRPGMGNLSTLFAEQHSEDEIMDRAERTAYNILDWQWLQSRFPKAH